MEILNFFCEEARADSALKTNFPKCDSILPLPSELKQTSFNVSGNQFLAEVSGLVCNEPQAEKNKRKAATPTKELTLVFCCFRLIEYFLITLLFLNADLLELRLECKKP